MSDLKSELNPPVDAGGTAQNVASTGDQTAEATAAAREPGSNPSHPKDTPAPQQALGNTSVGAEGGAAAGTAPKVGTGSNASISYLWVVENQARPGRLYFSPKPTGSNPPADQWALQRRFDDTQAAIQAAITDPSKYKAEFSRLLSYAETVFNGGLALIGPGQQWLDDINQDLILRTGPEIKNRYLKTYAIWALCSSLGILGISIVIRLLLGSAESNGFLVEVPPDKKALFSTVVFDNKIAPFHMGVVMASAMWGIWLARFWSSSSITIEQLKAGMEPDMYRPWSRLLGSGLAAFLAALILLTGVVQIRIGDYAATDMTNNLLVSVLVGLMLGCLDKLLPDFVQRPLTALLGSASHPAPDPHAAAQVAAAKSDGTN